MNFEMSFKWFVLGLDVVVAVIAIAWVLLADGTLSGHLTAQNPRCDSQTRDDWTETESLFSLANQRTVLRGKYNEIEDKAH